MYQDFADWFFKDDDSHRIGISGQIFNLATIPYTPVCGIKFYLEPHRYSIMNLTDILSWTSLWTSQIKFCWLENFRTQNGILCYFKSDPWLPLPKGRKSHLRICINRQTFQDSDSWNIAAVLGFFSFFTISLPGDRTVAHYIKKKHPSDFPKWKKTKQMKSLQDSTSKI